MKLVTLNNHQLTWDTRLDPTEPGVQHLPEYAGFTITAKGRAALHPAARHQARRSDPEEWPVDAPFAED